MKKLCLVLSVFFASELSALTELEKVACRKGEYPTGCTQGEKAETLS